VATYDDVRATLSDPRVSSDALSAGYPDVNAGAAARRTLSRPFIVMDNPEHDAQRRLLTRFFTVKRVEALRPRIQRLVNQLIDEMLAGPRPVDLVQAFALPVPSLVICELLGVPYADRAMFHQLSKIVVSRTTTPEQVVSATEEMLTYLNDLIDAKTADPGDDILSTLAVEQVQTGLMTREELAGIGQLLLIAGHETTANMIALGTLALLRNPDQLGELRDSDDPALVANAVEELLRYLTIVHIGRRRVAREDLDIGDQRVHAGEGVIVATEIANRDAEAFPDPDQLDIHRKARHHVAFGYGIHQCLGQPLARVELQVVYSTLYRRVPTLALAIPFEEVNFKHDMLVYGVHSLPVTW
jgi:cytochrome P450